MKDEESSAFVIWGGCGGTRHERTRKVAKRVSSDSLIETVTALAFGNAFKSTQNGSSEWVHTYIPLELNKSTLYQKRG